MHNGNREEQMHSSAQLPGHKLKLDTVRVCESVSVGSSDHSEFKAVLAPRCRSSFLLRRFSPFLATLSVSPFPPSSYHHPDLPCCICLSNVNNDDHRSRSVRRRPRLHLDRNFVSRSGRTHPQHFGRMVCTCFFFAQSRPCSIA